MSSREDCATGNSLLLDSPVLLWFGVISKRIHASAPSRFPVDLHALKRDFDSAGVQSKDRRRGGDDCTSTILLFLAQKGFCDNVSLVRHSDGDSDVGGTFPLNSRASNNVGFLSAFIDVKVDPELVAAIADDADLIAALATPPWTTLSREAPKALESGIHEGIEKKELVVVEFQVKGRFIDLVEHGHGAFEDDSFD